MRHRLHIFTCLSGPLGFISKRPIFALTLVWPLLLGACVLDPVAPDLVTYVNQDILNIAGLEEKALERYAAVTGPNYISDEVFYEALRYDVVPNYRRFLELLRNIEPQTDEVGHLHVVYLRGAEQRYRGFKTMMRAIENQDLDLVRAANTQLAEGRAETEKWSERLTALYQVHGIVKKTNSVQSETTSW